ncbi:MAG: PrgI family protein [Planctomycetaceae bacterium]|jgi:hypothetical protein|nr:PrgI family protein [Planctomycetaceae bacterium]
MKLNENGLRIKRKRDGLSVRQWVVLAAAFIVGIGSTFVVREIFPPASAQAGVIRTSGLTDYHTK